jgi:hypothetical protein
VRVELLGRASAGERVEVAAAAIAEPPWGFAQGRCF